MIKAECTPRGFDKFSTQTITGMLFEVGGPSQDCCFSRLGRMEREHLGEIAWPGFFAQYVLLFPMCPIVNVLGSSSGSSPI